MKTFHVFTIFPKAFDSYLDASILGRAQKKKILKIKIYDIRKFAKDKHKTVDDRPFGGGPGMVMKVEPIVKAVNSALKRKIKNKKSKIVLFSASGKQFTQSMARNWAGRYKDIVLICGHYEGVDERLKKALKDLGGRVEELSVGPYILSGGELPAMVVVDAVMRHVPGVLGKSESLEEKKGSYPVYTRPDIFVFKGKKYKVPPVLLSGDHKKIEKWRQKR
jgi:tRNA (guanine37-N1)-methyltransferase